MPVPKRPSILVIEDVRTQAKAMEIILSADGFVVTCEMDLGAGLAAIRAESFDLILLDLVLPDATDLEGLDRVRATAPGTPVVVSTSLSDDAIAIQALQHGAEDYVIKGNFDSGLLLRTVRYAIERHRSKAKLQALTEELQSKNEELAKLSEQKDQFLSIASHDLRNPLGVILGYCRFLQRSRAGALNETQAEAIATMVDSAKYMLGLIEDLLDFSTIQADSVRLDLLPMDVREPVKKALTGNRMSADSKNIQFSVDGMDEPLTCNLDANRIEQVMNNLLSNATKYSHPGSTVRVSVSRTAKSVRISVSDEGIGIKDEDRAKLFQPFQRSSVRGTAGEKSTGLGLSIVRSIVEAHGGRVEVESEVGKGTTFRVVLPRAGSASERAVRQETPREPKVTTAIR
jgi:two-component system, sensor histidine kinase and response regulator